METTHGLPRSSIWDVMLLSCAIWGCSTPAGASLAMSSQSDVLAEANDGRRAVHRVQVPQRREVLSVCCAIFFFVSLLQILLLDQNETRPTAWRMPSRERHRDWNDTNFTCSKRNATFDLCPGISSRHGENGTSRVEFGILCLGLLENLGGFCLTCQLVGLSNV